MATYRIKNDGFFMGKFHKAGAEVELNRRQAKYPLMQDHVELVSDKKEEPKSMTKETGARRMSSERSSRSSVGGRMGIRR